MKLMATTKLKAGIAGALVITGVVTSLLIQQQARARLHEQDESSRQQARQLAQLAADNGRLANLAAQANDSAANAQLDELRKLRTEAELLRAQAKKLDALRDENGRLQQLPSPQPQTPLQVEEMVWAKQECVGPGCAHLSRMPAKTEASFQPALSKPSLFGQKTSGNPQASPPTSLKSSITVRSMRSPTSTSTSSCSGKGNLGHM